MSQFLPAQFRSHFPALNSGLVYLDSAATALKPQAVIDATTQFYQLGATVHRSQHAAAQQLTAEYEQCRQQLAEFLGAPDWRQIIWTRGTTEAINLVAQSWLAPQLSAGDEILVSELEHHANLVPWLILAKRCGAKVVKWPIDNQGLPDMALLPKLLTSRTRLLAITQQSNVTGARPPLPEIIGLAHAAGVKVLVDGAQGIVHDDVNLTQLNADFYSFSAHKLYGPTGLGGLYVSANCLAEMQPWQGGGKMISQVSFAGFEWQPAPWGFEPGTPNMAAVIGFAAALSFIQRFDIKQMEAWSLELALSAEQQLAPIAGFRSFRHPQSSLLAFEIKGLHHSDLVSLLAERNVAVRAGQHCAQPLMQALGVSGTLRASFAPYNQPADVEALVSALHWAREILAD